MNPDDNPANTSLLPSDPYWQSYTDALYNTQLLLHDIRVAEDNYSHSLMASYALANSKSPACTSRSHGEDLWLSDIDVQYWKNQVERLWVLMGDVVEYLKEAELKFDFWLSWRLWEDAEEELDDRMAREELKGEVDRLVAEGGVVDRRGWGSEP
jgi:hypothetical protein